MISLDQVILLEKKVESAVAKIQQLKAENDALRSKCAELTNALSAKSEQLSSFVNDQSQIEDGIRKALDRLNSIENSVIKAAISNEPDVTKTNPVVQQASFQDLKPVQTKPVAQPKPIQATPVVPDPAESIEANNFAEEIFENPEDSIEQNYTDEIPENSVPEDGMYQQTEAPEDFSNAPEGQTDFGFDIF